MHRKLQWSGTRVKTHYLTAATPAAERLASLRVAAKIAAGFVEALDRIADTLFALLLPGARFWLQRATRK
jgi:hypothetical protein